MNFNTDELKFNPSLEYSSWDVTLEETSSSDESEQWYFPFQPEDILWAALWAYTPQMIRMLRELARTDQGEPWRKEISEILDVAAKIESGWPNYPTDDDD